MENVHNDRTPLIAFIGIVLTYPHVWIPKTPLYLACSFLARIHIVWQFNLKASNDKDTEKILECEQKMRESLKLSKTEAPKGFLVFSGWAHYIYVFITRCLILLTGYINNSKSSQIIVLPNNLRAWLEKSPELGNKNKDEFVAEILRKHISLQDKEHQNINAGSSPLSGKIQRENTGENTK